MIKTKKCTKCKKILPFSKFWKGNDSNGLKYTCIKCTKSIYKKTKNIKAKALELKFETELSPPLSNEEIKKFHPVYYKKYVSELNDIGNS